MLINGYRTMWVMAMFDLPVDSREARRNYTRFRKLLEKDGFQRLQFSVYARPCASRENAEVHQQRIGGQVPPDGEVRLLVFTDKQFERMRIFWGKLRKSPERAPKQLNLF